LVAESQVLGMHRITHRSDPSMGFLVRVGIYEADQYLGCSRDIAIGLWSDFAMCGYPSIPSSSIDGSVFLACNVLGGLGLYCHRSSLCLGKSFLWRGQVTQCSGNTRRTPKS
jgi:hypothetical protein